MPTASFFIRTWLDRQIKAYEDRELHIGGEVIANITNPLDHEIQIKGVNFICDTCGFELTIDQRRKDEYYQISFQYGKYTFFELIRKED